jgi:hypothetical protein
MVSIIVVSSSADAGVVMPKAPELLIVDSLWEDPEPDILEATPVLTVKLVLTFDTIDEVLSR